MVDLVISGGQTGADIGGLVGARRAGVRTGGTAPRGWRTEAGPQRATLLSFGLVESPDEGYPARTEKNASDSDLTIIFARDASSSGTKATIAYCRKYGKPFQIINPFSPMAGAALAEAIATHKPRVLNVAGNRESKSPGIARAVAALIEEGLGSTIP